ncbi:MAG: XkdF-like putative serine protease domain-containing protein [Solirubrobacteraceae bacterium]
MSTTEIAPIRRRRRKRLYKLSGVNVRSLSVVPRGANRQVWALLKQRQQLERVVPILKANGSWQTAYIVVAAPGAVEDGGLGASGIEDTWSAQEIRKAAHSFARNGSLTTAGHFGQPFGKVVESYIATCDQRIGGQLVKAGSWVLGFQPSTEGRKAIESGQLTGVSIEGSGIREPVLKAATPTHALLEGVGLGATLPAGKLDPSKVDLSGVASLSDQEAKLIHGVLGRPDHGLPPVLAARLAVELARRAELRDTVQKFMASSGLR